MFGKLIETTYNGLSALLLILLAGVLLSPLCQDRCHVL